MWHCFFWASVRLWKRWNIVIEIDIRVKLGYVRWGKVRLTTILLKYIFWGESILKTIPHFFVRTWSSVWLWSWLVRLSNISNWFLVNPARAYPRNKLPDPPDGSWSGNRIPWHKTTGMRTVNVEKKLKKCIVFFCCFSTFIIWENVTY